MNNWCICWFFHAYIKEMHGSRSIIPSKKSRPYIHISRLRAKQAKSCRRKINVYVISALTPSRPDSFHSRHNVKAKMAVTVQCFAISDQLLSHPTWCYLTCNHALQWLVYDGLNMEVTTEQRPNIRFRVKFKYRCTFPIAHTSSYDQPRGLVVRTSDY